MNNWLKFMVYISSLLVVGVVSFFLIKGLPLLAIMLSILWTLQLFVLYKVTIVRDSKQGSKEE